MDLRYFRTSFDYNAWANDVICRTALELTDDAYFGPAGLSFDSVHATLLHVFSSEIGWLARWQGSPPGPHLSVEQVPTLAALRKRWEEKETKLEGYLGSLSDDSLRRDLRYVARSGHEEVRPLWQLLAHSLIHSVQFRSEAAVALTRFGHSPGELDLLVYLRQHPG